MVEETGPCTLPFIDTKSNQRDDPGYHGHQGACVGPTIKATTQTGTRGKERQSSSQKPTA